MDKYQEALERAKELHEAGNALTKLQMEIVFPELKQSEDERIRTRLIALVEAFGQGEYKDEMLAYLERTKEQKPIFKKGDRVIWDDEEFNILDVNETEYNVGGYRVPFSRQNELHPIGQKPAEWSEEDKTNLKDLHKFLFSLGDLPHTTYVRLDSWLKSLRPQPHWKPSEEQMEEYSYWYKNFIESGLASPSSKAVNVLGELLEQLKKL